MSGRGLIAIPADSWRHESIRAAAGSGKTYQLVSRYLRLVALGARPASILASTFTRLAAGEIRDRVLGDLAAAVTSEEDRARLAVRLGVAGVSVDQAADMLAELAADIHRLQARTIESFFAAVVRAFAPELGLPVGAEVIDEHEAVELRREAIARLLDERSPQPLIDLLRRLVQGGSDRNVRGEIDKVISSLAEVQRHCPPEAWECVAELPGGRLPLPQVVEAIHALEACSVNSGRARLFRAWQKDVQHARRMDWDDFLSSGIAGSLAGGRPKYGQTVLEIALVEAYRPLVAHAKAEVVHRWRLMNLATRDLLSLYRDREERLKQSRGVLTFADLTGALARAEALGTIDEIAFRLDAHLHHLLVDEFQDTSLLQWRALEPLVREIASVAAPERSFFCVGDAKQSIYVWRDAAPELHERLPGMIPGLMEVDLSCNRRSAPPIIDAVNRVFTGLDSNPALAGRADAAEAFLKSFTPHTTHEDNASVPGRVEVRVVRRAATGEDQKLVRLRAAADLVQQLHLDHPQLRIGVLTRSNPTVARLLHELGPGRRDVPASGQGGGPLIDAPAVTAMLDLLRLAEHPDDTIAAFNVAQSPLGEHMGFREFDSPRARQRIARLVRRAALEDGLAATIARWARSVAGDCEPRELRRAIQLVELAAGFDGRRSLRLDHFAGLVEEAKVADSHPAPVAAMTIHQAKGLEFDAVVLPELEFKLVGRSPAIVIERDGPVGAITRVVRHVNEQTRAFVPALGSVFEGHDARAARESLSLLYVAMTRAKRFLVALIDPPKENEKTHPKTAAGVLRHALGDCPAAPSAVIHASGQAEWAPHADDKGKELTPPEPPVADSPATIELAPSQPSQRRLARAAAGAEVAASRRIDDEPFAPPHEAAAPWEGEARDRGTALHALLERVGWIEDGVPDQAVIGRVLLEAAPRRSDRWRGEIAERFAAMLKSPAISRWFTRGGRPAASIDLRREQPFARLEDDAVVVGRLDRVVAERSGVGEGAAFSRATVLDFKSDAIDAAAAPALAERYRDQLESYRRAAAELYGLEAAAVRMVVLFLSPAVAVELPPKP